MLEAVNVSKSFEGKSVIRAFSAKLEKGRRSGETSGTIHADDLFRELEERYDG